MKSMREIQEQVTGLSETKDGVLVAGFTVLAPEQQSVFVGGMTGVNIPCKTTNTNCAGANCVSGCGGTSSPTTIIG